MMEPEYRVWGNYDGRGIVIRSEEPVDFHPDLQTVNVVPVDSPAATPCATRTWRRRPSVSIPPSRKAELRDALASAGVQRVVDTGQGDRARSPACRTTASTRCIASCAGSTTRIDLDGGPPPGRLRARRHPDPLACSRPAQDNCDREATGLAISALKPAPARSIVRPPRTRFLKHLVAERLVARGS